MKYARYILRIFQMSQGSGNSRITLLRTKIQASFGSSHNLVKLDALINLFTGNLAPLVVSS